MDGFFQQPDWRGDLGSRLMGFGAGLQGRDPMAPRRAYQEGIEREERKGNIAALMGNMGISGNRRAALEMLPQAQQLSWLMEQQDATAAQAAAAAQYQREAEAAAASQAEFNAMIAQQGGQTNIPVQQDAWNAAVSTPLTPPQFGGPQVPTSIPTSAPFEVGYEPTPTFDQAQGFYRGGPTGATNLADITLSQATQDIQPSRLGDIPAPQPMGGIGPMPTQAGGDPSLGDYGNYIKYTNMAKDENLTQGQRDLSALLAQREEATLGFGGDDPTSLMQNYGMYSQQAEAAGEQPMSFIDYQNAVKAGTNISIDTGGAEIGAIPPGYEVYTDPETQQRAMRLIPGGPAEARVSEFSAEQAREMGKRESDAQSMLNAIDTVMNHPSLENILGPIEGRRETFFTQGTSDALAAADQLTGKVFMEAYQGLKGGGQITEIEGEKAQNAIARLQRTQSPEAYKAALDDLKGIITKALERSRTGTSERAEELSDAELLEKYR